MKKFFESFKYAGRGIAYIFRTERNFRFHVLVGAVIFVLMVYFHVTANQAIFLTYAIGSVLILEIINTVLERVTDILKPRVHPYAAVMKDLMAAAVLIAAMGAIISGVLILGPYVLNAARNYL
jgi:diacylglycerol kinase